MFFGIWVGQRDIWMQDGHLCTPSRMQGHVHFGQKSIFLGPNGHLSGTEGHLRARWTFFQSAPVPQKSTFWPKVNILRARWAFEWDGGTFECKMDICTKKIFFWHLVPSGPICSIHSGLGQISKCAQMYQAGMDVPWPGDKGTAGPAWPFGPWETLCPSENCLKVQKSSPLQSPKKGHFGQKSRFWGQGTKGQLGYPGHLAHEGHCVHLKIV
jgi:hypothetical protein